MLPIRRGSLSAGDEPLFQLPYDGNHRLIAVQGNADESEQREAGGARRQPIAGLDLRIQRSCAPVHLSRV